ncbi:hypothetical protein B0T19DRAFT_219172 [Cercophora scortea]|uniref:Uncharacterized protein n=1 Tax=Cercophora scortea TaxID=314031 RepID=A0AAE0IGR4_9PEZI|nr:hypothetical protein B0T19DRAFT_219172 [Cercophora scortea]
MFCCVFLSIICLMLCLSKCLNQLPFWVLMKAQDEAIFGTSTPVPICSCPVGRLTMSANKPPRNHSVKRVLRLGGVRYSHKNNPELPSNQEHRFCIIPLSCREQMPTPAKKTNLFPRIKRGMTRVGFEPTPLARPADTPRIIIQENLKLAPQTARPPCQMVVIGDVGRYGSFWTEPPLETLPSMFVVVQDAPCAESLAG